MASLQTELRLTSPDDFYEELGSLAEGLSDTAGHSALAAFALLLANHIGDEAVLREAIVRVKAAFKEHPEAAMVGIRDPDKVYQVGGALDSLRKIIEVNPAPTLPGALTS
jgi:hypothetical protein